MSQLEDEVGDRMSYCLCYPDAATSPNRRAAVNAATAFPDTSGYDEAKLWVFSGMIKMLRERRSSEAESDGLCLEKLAESVYGRASAAGIFETIDTNLQTIELCRDQHREFDDPTSKSSQEIKQLAADEVNERLIDRERLTYELVQADPLHASEQIGLFLDQLANARRPVDKEAVSRHFALGGIANGLRCLQTHANIVPGTKRELLRSLLYAEAEEIQGEGCRDVCGKWVFHEFQKSEERIRGNLRSLSKRVANFERAISRVIQAFEERIRKTRSARSSVGLKLLLPGPTAQECKDSLARRYHVAESDVPSCVLVELTSKLKRDSHSKKALCDQSAAAMVDALDHVCHQSFPKWTIYRAVRKYGPEEVANALYQNAEPLVHLIRQSERLGVDTMESAIVTVPRPASREDEETLHHLEAALGSCSNHRIVKDESDSESTEIVVFRATAGFSAAIVSDNYAMARTYAESDEFGHVPHMVGICKHAMDGRASEQVRSIVRGFSTDEEKDRGDADNP